MPYQYGPQDQTAQRMQRVLGIPMGDGRVFKNGVIVSASDHAAAESTRQQNDTYAAQAQQQAIQPGSTPGGMPTVPGSQVAGPAAATPSPIGPMDPARPRPASTGAIDVNSYAGSRYAPGGPPPIPGSQAPGMGVDVTGYNGSRYSPDFNANNPQPAAPNPQSQFIRQQLLAMNGTDPARIYTPATLAKATDAQVAGELAAQKPRNEFIDSLTKRTQAATEAGAGFGTYQEAAASLPTGVTGDFIQDVKTGRWRANKTEPTKPDAGFGTAAEAQASIPKGSKGQVSQTASGRWVVQYGINDAPASPESPLAKMQADLARAQKEGRTEDAKALQAEITKQASTEEKPFNVREFQQQPDLMKQYGMSYGKYLTDFNRLKAEKSASGSAAPAAGGATAPVAVKTKADRDALPAGTKYAAPDGKIYTKK